jgi:hypothetical protein
MKHSMENFIPKDIVEIIVEHQEGVVSAMILVGTRKRSQEHFHKENH